MPHTYPDALKAHLKGRSITVAIGCTMTRRDGFVFGMTTHRQSATINGVLHRSQPGMLASALMSKSNMEVDNAEIQGFIDDVLITDDDLRRGLWDDAAMHFFIYNYNDLSMGTGFLGAGHIGNVSISSNGTFSVEFRSLEQLLAQEIGVTTSATCRYKRLGHYGCPVNVLFVDALGRDITQAGTVSSITDETSFASSLTGAPDGFFKNGMVTFTSGLNTGISAQVQDFTGGVFTLFEPMPLPVQAGDAFNAEEGCDRELDTCYTNFNVVWAFDGEPGIPGPDGIYGSHQ